MFGLSSAMIQYDIAGMKPGEKNRLQTMIIICKYLVILNIWIQVKIIPDYLIREKKKRGEKIQPVLWLVEPKILF